MSQHELLERLGGDTDLLKEIIALFLDDCPALMVSIRAALEASDAQALNRAAHQLKGSAGNFDAAALTALAQRVESLARDGDLAAAEAVMPALQEAVDALLGELAALPKELSAAR